MNLKYEQPKMDEIIPTYKDLLVQLKDAKIGEAQLQIISKINEIREFFFSMYWLSYMHYLMDVNDEYWQKQEAFFAENDPVMEQLKLQYYDALNHSPFQDVLKKEIGNKAFKIAETEVRLMSDKTTEDAKKEKELANAYSKLIASAKVSFQNQDLTLKQLSKYTLSEDRKIRIEASKVKYDFMENIEKDIDQILEELVKVRTHTARTLGFTSYTDVGYVKLKRLGYGKQDVEIFRNEIVEYIVPLVQKIKQKQKQDLGVDTLMYYDESILYKDGNAVPKGDTNWTIKQALKMYKKISPEIYYLFKKMIDENLMDLDSRPGKSSGAITTYIPKDKVPIFIASLNGTSYDVQTVTHEFGHSFQLYSSRNLKYYENWWPTFDTCEIHSTSMELLTLPYAEMFFGEDKEKYVNQILSNQLEDMCYIALVDAFQHILYDKPNLTSKERKEAWRKLEKKYMPWLHFGENEYLERGNTWQNQNHIFTMPFYFIDYALAASIALQFYDKSLEDPKGTWEKYISFCHLGGYYSFVETVDKIGLKSPFEKDTLKNLIKKLEKRYNVS